MAADFYETGIPLTIDSGDPVNYFQAISDTHKVPARLIHARLFLPKETELPVPAVIVTPGSLGVAPSHMRHARTLVGEGIAACVIDPFGARNVTSTVANQAQYSFAASAWDVVAAAQVLAAHNDIDSSRIGAQGHSRGGSAALMSATSRFVGGIGGEPLAAVYAAYPWCGHQFLDPSVGGTVVRSIIGDMDEWCSPQQVQGHMNAIRLAGGKASYRIVGGAQHSFDRDTEIEVIEDASVAPGAPTAYIDEHGAFVHPLTGEADPALKDRDLMVYGMKAGYGRRGARIGSNAGEAQLFSEDMLSFWREVLR
jgi:dienelactone hydrolase